MKQTIKRHCSLKNEWKRNVVKGTHYVLVGEAHVKTPARPSTCKVMEYAGGIIKAKIFLKNWPCSLYKVNHVFII